MLPASASTLVQDRAVHKRRLRDPTVTARQAPICRAQTSCAPTFMRFGRHGQDARATRALHRRVRYPATGSSELQRGGEVDLARLYEAIARDSIADGRRRNLRDD